MFTTGIQQLKFMHQFQVSSVTKNSKIFRSRYLLVTGADSSVYSLITQYTGDKVESHAKIKYMVFTGA